jgi:hypothetical protein
MTYLYLGSPCWLGFSILGKYNDNQTVDPCLDRGINIDNVTHDTSLTPALGSGWFAITMSHKAFAQLSLNSIGLQVIRLRRKCNKGGSHFCLHILHTHTVVGRSESGTMLESHTKEWEKHHTGEQWR